MWNCRFFSLTGAQVAKSPDLMHLEVVLKNPTLPLLPILVQLFAEWVLSCPSLLVGLVMRFIPTLYEGPWEGAPDRKPHGMRQPCQGITGLLSKAASRPRLSKLSRRAALRKEPDNWILLGKLGRQ